MDAINPDSIALKIPPELTDMVFSYLDPRSLSACASTCRAWLSLSQARIFETIVASPGKATRLQQLLSESPHLGKHIKELQMGITSPDDFITVLQALAGYLGSVRTLGANIRGALPPIPPSLADIGPVETLWISIEDEANFVLHLAQLLREFHHTCTILLPNPPLPRITSLPGSDADFNALSDALHHLHLTRLELNGMFRLFDKCFQMQPPKNIRILRFDLFDVHDVPESRSMFAIIAAAASSLERLQIEVHISVGRVDVPEWQATAVLCPSLSRLVCTVHPTQYTLILALLSHITAPQLKHIGIRLNFWIVMDRFTDDLRAVSRLLQDTRRFPALRLVNLTMRGGGILEEWNEAKESVEEIFMPLIERGILSSNYEYEPDSDDGETTGRSPPLEDEQDWSDSDEEESTSDEGEE
ncbi:hypothetical protein OBBRIDRAFT_891355 [Obba rivulosa]|uniref:F-box domain-containing protein n=1 Tax=Obba rivulosa TaxID=1052685 RepID=A0A8E2DFP7_9APHY|nr:hypothetical protein OBBRIDRAFT_891355 [Obba rivulosa]